MERTSIFRFVTIRTPQQISANTDSITSIRMPSGMSSHFLDSVQGVTEQSDITTALIAAADSFTSFVSYRDAMDINVPISDFSGWLNLNKDDMDIQDIEAQVTSITPYNETDQISLWDNLFNQAVVNESSLIAETSIALLKANHFINEFNTFRQSNSEDQFTEEEKATFKKIANASVVLPRKIAVPQRNNASTDAPSAFRSYKAIIDKQEADIARKKAGKYEKVRVELENTEKIFIDEVAQEYDAAYATYLSDVDALIAGVTPVEDPETGEITYPGVTIPEFSFTPTVELNRDYIAANISPSALLAYDEVKNDSQLTLEDTMRAMDGKIVAEYEKAYTNLPAANKVLQLAGATYSIEERPADKGLAIKAVPLSLGSNDYTYYVTQHFSNDSIRSTSFTLEVELPDGSTQIDYKGNVVSDTGNYVTLQFFSQGITHDDQHGEHSVSGTFTLNNDAADSIPFSGGGMIPSSGSPILIGPDDNAEVDPSGGSSTHIAEPVNAPKANQYGVTNIGVAVFRRVEQELCCYVAGEVSNIENVMAREYREKESRTLTRTELTEERIAEQEIENLTDTTATDRYEMQKESEKTVEEQRSRDGGFSTGVAGNFMFVSFNADAFMNFSSSNSASQSDSVAVSQAKEVTERTLERIVKKVTEKRISKMMREYEEKNTHGYDNREGDEHVTGIYRWVDKVYNNHLVNYGKRLVYEFMLPEPSRNFKLALKKQTEAPANAKVIEKPPHPIDDLWMWAPDGITQHNYQFLAGVYGADVDEYPRHLISVSRSYNRNIFEMGDHTELQAMSASYNDLEVPEGYYCETVQITHGYTGLIKKPHYQPQADVNIGNVEANFGKDKWGNRYGDTPNKLYATKWIEGTVPVAIGTVNMEVVGVNVTANCRVKPTVLQQWQVNTFNSIMEAYRKKLQAYNDALDAGNTTKDFEAVNKLSINPLQSRAIEKREIKRISIELLTSPFPDIYTALENYTLSALNTGVMKINDTKALEKHAGYAKFFEQAFEWDLMAYKFFPYFYADEHNWFDLITTTNDADQIFQAFLQAGMARAMVPVREGFEEAVMFYMETGKVWNGKGFTVGQNDDLFRSIEDDLQTEEGVREGTWQTRVPTALTIIQRDSKGLEADGLPKKDPTQTETDPCGPGNNIAEVGTPGGSPKLEKINPV